jgi:tetratricopeptide (TPR) repeat protein
MKRKEKQPPVQHSEPAALSHAFLLVVLCFAIYANGLSGDFVWDDQVQLYRNTKIRTLDNIPEAFTTSLWSFMYSQDPTADNRAFDQYYRPIQTVIYMLVYQLAGLSPFAYHLANLTLHCAATLLVYLLCLKLGLDSLVSLLAGALFAAHPVHTEAVTWIAGVGDLACGTFYLAALLAFLQYLDTRGQKWLWLSSICLLAALFSKEMAATFPLVAFLIAMARQRDWRHFKTAMLTVSPFVVVMGIYATLRIMAVGLNVPPAMQVSLTAMDWVTLGIWILGGYLRYAIVPYPLYIYHLSPLYFGDRIFSTLAYAAIIAAIALFLVFFRRRFFNQLLWFAIFFISLLPVLYFKGISGGVFFAERYLYVPSVAMIVIAGFSLARLKRRHAILVTGAVAGIFSFLTIQRNRDWHDEESLYARTLQFQPQAANISTSLGEVYLRKGDNAGAQKYFELSLQHIADSRFIQSSYESYRIYHGLGLAAARQSKPAEAVAHLQKALEIYPQGDGAYTTLGGVFVSQGWNHADAMTLLEKAIKLNPVNDLARDYMGVALMNQGQVEPAIRYFREALEINPELESARQHLEVALRTLKK